MIRNDSEVIPKRFAEGAVDDETVAVYITQASEHPNER